MDDWKTLLKADPTDWLLEDENPSVRYFALRDISDRPEDDAKVQSAKREIMRTGMVRAILDMQREPAYLQTYPRFYTCKYKGLVWSLIVLAELGAGVDPQIREQCEYMLDNAQEKKDGGFAQTRPEKRAAAGSPRLFLPDRENGVEPDSFGYLEDPRLRRARLGSPG